MKQDPNIKREERTRTRIIVRKVVAARKAAGLTQAQLADKIGVSRSVYNRLEHGTRGTIVRYLPRIAAALGIDEAALMPGKPGRRPKIQ